MTTHRGTRWPVLTLTVAVGWLAAACGAGTPDADEDRRPEVQFEFGEKQVHRDSSEVSYITVSRRPVRALGPDSDRPHLLAVETGPSVSLEAGTAPERGIAMTYVQNRRGVISTTSLPARCAELGEDDCFEEYMRPRHTFQVHGFVPLHPLPDSTGPLRHPVSDSLTVVLGAMTVEQTTEEQSSVFTARIPVELTGPGSDRPHVLVMSERDSLEEDYGMPGNPPQLHLSWVIDGTDTITYRRSRMRCEGFPEPMHDMLDCSDEPLQPNVLLRPVGIQALQPVSPDGHVRGSLADSLVRGTRSVTLRAEGSMWRIRTEAVVRLHGVDSTSFYLGLARARARRSLTAGEAPFSGIDYGWGRGDSLQFGLTETPLRCGELMTRNCLEDATDPELRFTPVGLLPFFRGDTTAAGRAS